MIRWERKPSEVFSARRLEAAMERATIAGGRDGLRTVDVESRRAIRALKRFKVSALTKARTLTFPRATARGARKVWELIVRGAPVPLAAFPHRQTKRGVSVEVKPGGRKIAKGAFVATMKSGHRGIFKRATTKALRRGPKPKRAALPIRELFTTRVTDVWRDVLPEAMRKGQVKFRETWTRVFRAELQKGRR